MSSFLTTYFKPAVLLNQYPNKTMQAPAVHLEPAVRLQQQESVCADMKKIEE